MFEWAERVGTYLAVITFTVLIELYGGPYVPVWVHRLVFVVNRLLIALIVVCWVIAIYEVIRDYYLEDR